MPSIIPGYEYDIFISYRQKDNKLDGWVTEFINTLKSEIEATFKEYISIYFDENPYDGLLETHDVDDSLAKKLKCLIFIPIISKTYCDPNSFAWTNEFLAFNKMAEADDHGLKVELPNGNTASRVLPIRIHDISDADRQLVEDEVGFLRSIDFVYQEPGVNRPLKPEDNKEDNLNRTNYRNQINKVANAIQEIVSGLKIGDSFKIEKEGVQSTSTIASPSIESKPKNKSKILLASIGVILILALAYFFYNNQKDSETVKIIDKSIAVIPFADMSPQGDQQYFADGVMEDILTNLQKMGELRVISRTSVEQYRDTKKPANEIGTELKVSYLLVGSVRKSEDQIMITAQLISTDDDRHIWADNFTSEYTTRGIFDIQRKIAEEIVSQLKLKISPEEVSGLTTLATESTEAYEYYIRGKQYAKRYHNKTENQDYENAVSLYRRALEADPNFALAYAGLAEVYYDRNFFREYLDEQPLDSMLMLCNRALEIDPNLAEAYTLRGQYYYWIANSKTQALEDLDQALEINPNYTEAMLQLADIHFLENNFSVRFRLLVRASPLIKGSELTELYMQFARLYLSVGDYEKAEHYFNEVIKIQPDHVLAYGGLAHTNRCQGKFKQNLPIAEKLKAINPEGQVLYHLAIINMMNGNYHESEKYFRQLYDSSPDVIRIQGYNDKHMYSYVLKQNGKEEEAHQNLIEIRDFLLEVVARKRQWAKGIGYELAKVYAQLGDKDEALKWLEHYGNFGFGDGLHDFALYDPPLESLWDDPRFQQIIQQGREQVEKARAEIEKLEASEEMKVWLSR